MLYILVILLGLHATMHQPKMTVNTPQTIFCASKGFQTTPHDIAFTTRQRPVGQCQLQYKAFQVCAPVFSDDVQHGHLFSTRCLQSCGTVFHSCSPRQVPGGCTGAIPQHVTFTCMHAPCTAAYLFSMSCDERHWRDLAFSSFHYNPSKYVLVA